jgi:hypothetical protein
MTGKRFLWAGLALVLAGYASRVGNPSDGMFLLCAAVFCGSRALEQ